VPAEILDGSFRLRLEPWLGANRATVWLAAPFLTFPIAQWLATLPASRHGDRRLLIAWDRRSIDAGYLNPHGVDVLRASGYAVRNLPALHAKVVVAGARAYVGSGNLTSYGIDGGNTELGVFLTGSSVSEVKKLYDKWWKQATPLTTKEIGEAKARWERLAALGGRRIDGEFQPGRQPPQPKHAAPAVDPPDAAAARSADPPAVVHFWKRETIAENTGLAGRRHSSFLTGAPMARRIEAGTRVYTVGWAPFGGLVVLNAFTVTRVRKARGGWRVTGEDATPLVFNRVLSGRDYARTVRIRNQRQAPTSHMSFTPMAYLSQRTATALERLVAQ
jgi:hypothetical protein